GELDGQVDLLQARGADEGLGRVQHDGFDLGVYDGPSQPGVDDDPQPGQVVGVQPRLPALDAGKAVGVPRVVPVHDVEPAGDVAHRPGQAAEDDGEGRHLGEGPARVAAVCRLEPRQPGVAGGDA